jgi:hypothetical protein
MRRTATPLQRQHKKHQQWRKTARITVAAMRDRFACGYNRPVCVE